jgi:nitrite reductase (NO-forming)
MGRAQRLTAASVLVCLVSAACGGTAQPTEPPAASPYPTIDVLQPDPNAPPVYPRDARAPARLPGTTHDIDLLIDERHNTIAEGLVREVWAFGGTVPGPVIRVQLGDTIRIHLDNHPPELPGRAAWMHPAVNHRQHSVVLDAAAAAPNEIVSIKPGQKRVYEVEAAHAGVWLYHCATEPTLEHLANGEYGMVIVEPEGGLEAVDQEFFLVQGEWYVAGPHQSASMAKAAAAVPVPDFVVFNGIADQYLGHPIQIETGKRVRVFILNAGPNLDSSFNVEGTIFDGVIREGIDLGGGSEGGGGSQAIDLSPGQGAIVEFTLTEDGLYPFVGRAFGFAGLGALGLFQAGYGDPLN